MDGVPPVLAEVPCPQDGTLHISWGLGNELFLCSTSSSGDLESTATCVQWGCLRPAQRRIAYDSQGSYQDLEQRQQGRDPRSPEAWADVLHYSQTLSAILTADSNDGELSADALAAAQERALLELLALFFVESGVTQGLISQDLARWLRRNAAALAGPAGPPLPPALRLELEEASLPEAHLQYWPTLTRLMALGRVAEAVELLGLHSAWLRWDGTAAAAAADPGSAAQVAALEAVTLLLRRFPALAAPAALGAGTQPAPAGAGHELATAAELLASHRRWQAQCHALLGAQDGQEEEDPSVQALWAACEDAAPETAEGLRAALAAAAGDEGALASATHSWPELLVGLLLHVHPAARPEAELRALLRRALAAAPPAGSGSADFLAAAAGVLEACAEGEAALVMPPLSAWASDWLLAHAPLLMAAHPAGAAVLTTELPHDGGSQAEFYTLEYAMALMPHTPMHQLAASYLAWCPAHGRAATEALLRRLPLDPGNAGLALAILALAEGQGLTGAAEHLAVRMGVAAWQAGQLGAALVWLARADDARRTDVALSQLAAGVSGGGSGAASATATAAALGEQLEALPAGSAHAALLQVHRLLASGGSDGGSAGAGSLQAAVDALARLHPAMRDSCLRLVCAAVPALPPGALRQHEVALLLEWLQGAEERLPSAGAERTLLQQGISVSRLALVRSLAAAHMLVAT